MNCDYGGKSQVLETRRGAKDEPVRKRKCIKCGVTFFTEERTVPGPKVVWQYTKKSPKKNAEAKAKTKAKKAQELQPTSADPLPRQRSARERIEDAREDRRYEESDADYFAQK